MKNIYLKSILISACYMLINSAVSYSQVKPGYKNYIVKINPKTKEILAQNSFTSALLRRHFSKIGLTPLYPLSVEDLYLVRVRDRKLLTKNIKKSEARTLKSKIKRAAGGISNIEKYFEVFEPDYETNFDDVAYNIVNSIQSAAAIIEPNDPETFNFNSWGLDPYYGANAKEAWGLSTGTADQVVAVLGTGIDLTHPDLVNNIWQDSAPSAVNKKETQKGFNIYNSATANLPVDDHGITTFAAGIIGARGNNNIGIAGINWNVKLMAVKVMNSSFSSTISQYVEGIDYIIRKKQAGANVSVIFNFRTFSSDSGNALRNKIQQASDAGILFVTAAGDNGLNVDTASVIPSNFTLPNIITVGSYYGVLNQFKPPHFSDVYYSNLTNAPYGTYNANYGLTKVHLAAPGERVRGCWKNSAYVDFAGTTVAAAYVAGAASLAKSFSPSSTMLQVKDAILNNVRVYQTELGSRVATKGVLDIFKALESLKTVIPGDYDLDGDVDGRDFLVWQRNFGATGPNPADGNKDGKVDAADYTIWMDNFGRTS